MRYPTEPKYAKYVKGNGFLPFARKCNDKYGKKLTILQQKEEYMLQKLLLKGFSKKLQKRLEI